MKITLEPIGRQVIVQAIEEEGEQSFIVPEQVRKKRLAKVIAAGPTTAQVKKGDVVAFRNQLMFDFEVSGEKYLVCDEEALCCIVRYGNVD